MANINEIEKLVNANYPVIWIETAEERRVIKDIMCSKCVGLEETTDGTGKKSIVIDNQKQLWMWSNTQGLLRIQGQDYKRYEELPPNPATLMPVNALIEVKNAKITSKSHKNMVVIMRDLHALMNIPMPGRKIKDMLTHLSTSNKTIIVIGPSNKIPEDLTKDVVLIHYDLPGPDEIKTYIEKVSKYMSTGKKLEVDPADKRYKIHKKGEEECRYRVKYNDDEMQNIIKSAQGLTEQEIICVFSKSVMNNENGEILPSIVAEEKKSIIKKSEVLEYWTKTEPFKDVGGNKELKTWLEQRGAAINGQAVEFGVRQPKGVLITGVQGCGKSMLAKAISGHWGLPCIRMDMGKVFAGLVGSSEKNVRDAIRQAEAMSPCILFIDEIEKGMAGMGSSNFSDGGTTSRVIATFISWLQDKTKPVFVIATANNVDQLPPELLRKGRMDELWFVDLPTENEREEIFRTHIARVGRDPKKFNCKQLSKVMFKGTDGKEYGYSGSEIEEAINDALFDAYAANNNAKPNGRGDITTKIVSDALKRSVPLSCTSADKINKIKKWGYAHAKFASDDAKKACDKKKNAKYADAGAVGELTP